MKSELALSSHLRATSPAILEKTSILIVDGDAMSMTILCQILAGFGARNLHKCPTLAQAERLTDRTEIDLLIIDPASVGPRGYDFVPQLRRASRPPNRFVQTVIVTGHTPRSRVQAARDAGANFVILKPIAPAILLSRIMWMVREKRGFVDSNTYVGPDRRFKVAGPPAGTVGRRSTDLASELGLATDPNLGQLDIDAIVKPQKVGL